ncbi:hypothetical protein PENSPDRAFT_567625 [Peniophora sp. CONT]|nr:hypothetical protein PENSPDRAFT_567625 [Peniophora sp. CONT]
MDESLHAGPTQHDTGETHPAGEPSETAQCRICLDGPDPDLGRLIRPCLCRGSISYVHVKCLNRWRESSNTAFFSCPQCHYRYNFRRTKVLGLATNPIVVATVSSILFTLIVIAASFVTTTFMSVFSEDPDEGSSYYYYSPYWTNPITVFGDLVRAGIRLVEDESGIPLDPNILTRAARRGERQAPPGLLMRFVQRFLLGLPMVGAGSLVQMLFTVGGLGPIQWLARSRARNRRNGRASATDTAALILVTLLLIGALRAVYKVYQLTEKWSQRLLLRAEDIILEVN